MVVSLMKITISSSDEKLLLSSLENISKIIDYDIYIEIKNTLLNAFSRKIITDTEINRITTLLENKKNKKSSKLIDKCYNYDNVTSLKNSSVKMTNNQNLIYQADIVHFKNALVNLLYIRSYDNKNQNKNKNFL